MSKPMTRREIMDKLGIKSRTTFIKLVQAGKIKQVTPLIPEYIIVEEDVHN